MWRAGRWRHDAGDIPSRHHQSLPLPESEPRGDHRTNYPSGSPGRSRRTSSSAWRQSIDHQSVGWSSGPFTITSPAVGACACSSVLIVMASNLSFGSGSYPGFGSSQTHLVTSAPCRAGQLPVSGRLCGTGGRGAAVLVPVSRRLSTHRHWLLNVADEVLYLRVAGLDLVLIWASGSYWPACGPRTRLGLVRGRWRPNGSAPLWPRPAGCGTGFPSGGWSWW